MFCVVFDLRKQSKIGNCALAYQLLSKFWAKYTKSCSKNLLIRLHNALVRLSSMFLCIRIKASKTDPFRQGVNICIGRTNNSLFPVSALLHYLVSRGSTPDLLFRFQDRTPPTKSKFTHNYRQLLTHAGINCTLYAGHSFRIGAATTVAAKGIEDSLIQTLGSWKSSAYVLLPAQTLAALSNQLAS